MNCKKYIKKKNNIKNELTYDLENNGLYVVDLSFINVYGSKLMKFQSFNTLNIYIYI